MGKDKITSFLYSESEEKLNSYNIFNKIKKAEEFYKFIPQQRKRK